MTLQLPFHSSDLKKLPAEEVKQLLQQLGPEQWDELVHFWPFWARPNQLAPEGNWKVWVALAGRGFGKTRTGVEWVRQQIKDGVGRVACVAPTKGDVRRVMVEGESGLLAVCHKNDKDYRGKPIGYPTWSPTNNTLTWENGAKAEFFSAEDPERLRGPQFEKAWCFVKGTTVHVLGGQAPVETLKVGDFVYTRSGFQPIIATSVRKVPVGTVTFSDGRTLTGTSDHPIMTQRGWVRLGKLTKEDKVCATVALNTQMKSGASAQMDTTAKVTGDCTEKSTSTLTAASHPDTTFTTKTKTNSTTIRRIFKHSLAKITCGITSVFGSQSASQKAQGKSAAQSVAQHSYDSASDPRSFVNPASIVKQMLNGQQSGPAKSVVTLSTPYGQLTALSVVSTWEEKGSENVYNIQVENVPEYYANGILTHNCDEICAWTRMQETWDMLQFTLRLGKRPQIFISTTPKPSKLLRGLVHPDMVKSGRVVLSTGSSYDNADNIDLEALKQYEGTRLGRQELYAEILDEAAGALWTRAILEKCDASHIEDPLEFSKTLARIVVAVDPAVTANIESDLTGIIVAGIDVNGTAYILEDATGMYLPEQWATRAVELYYKYQADRIVAERNQGGDMVKHTLKTVDETVPVKMVHASRGKFARAEPVSALYERGKVMHCRDLHDLEQQMVTWEPLGSIGSPDRLDAMVWAITDLLLKGRAQAPLQLNYSPLKGILQ